MLNYEEIAKISNTMVQCETAIIRLKEIAEKLAETQKDLDVEIILTESGNPKPKQFNQERPVQIICTSADLFEHAQTVLQKNQETQHYKKSGLKQNQMPNELALIMLDSMMAYYKRQKKVLEFKMINELAKLNVEQLQLSQTD